VLLKQSCSKKKKREALSFLPVSAADFWQNWGGGDKISNGIAEHLRGVLVLSIFTFKYDAAEWTTSAYLFLTYSRHTSSMCTVSHSSSCLRNAFNSSARLRPLSFTKRGAPARANHTSASSFNARNVAD
jgi:hypothetical protein